MNIHSTKRVPFYLEKDLEIKPEETEY